MAGRHLNVDSILLLWRPREPGCHQRLGRPHNWQV